MIESKDRGDEQHCFAFVVMVSEPRSENAAKKQLFTDGWNQSERDDIAKQTVILIDVKQGVEVFEIFRRCWKIGLPIFYQVIESNTEQECDQCYVQNIQSLFDGEIFSKVHVLED